MSKRTVRATISSVSPSRRLGFSLLEFLVILVIVGILLAISIPAIRDMRTLSRRSNCDQNLIRIALALQAYDSQNGHLPSGTLSFNATVPLLGNEILGNENVLNNENVLGNENVAQPNDIGVVSGDRIQIASIPEGYHHNWISACLPYLDREAIYQSIDFEAGVYAPTNAVLRESDLPLLKCPEAEKQLPSTTSYVGMHSSEAGPITPNGNGLLMLNRWVPLAEIADGAAFTILLGEKLSPIDWDLGWMSGTRSCLRAAEPSVNAEIESDRYRNPAFVGGLASRHLDGASVVFADGAVRFLNNTIDTKLYSEMVSRDDRTKTEPPVAEAPKTENYAP